MGLNISEEPLKGHRVALCSVTLLSSWPPVAPLPLALPQASTWGKGAAGREASCHARLPWTFLPGNDGDSRHSLQGLGNCCCQSSQRLWWKECCTLLVGREMVANMPAPLILKNRPSRRGGDRVGLLAAQPTPNGGMRVFTSSTSVSSWQSPPMPFVLTPPLASGSTSSYAVWLSVQAGLFQRLEGSPWL